MNTLIKLLFVLLFAAVAVAGVSLFNRNESVDTGGCETKVDLRHCVLVRCVVLELRSASALFGTNREALLSCDDGSVQSVDQGNLRVGDKVSAPNRDHRRLRW